MAEIRIQGPDGSSFSFPEGTPSDTITAAMTAHYGASKAPSPAAGELDDAVSRRPISAGFGAGVQGGGDALTFNYGDEVFGALAMPVEAALGAYSGEDDGKGFFQRVGDAYARGRDKSRALSADARKEAPGTYLAGQVGGGLAMASRLPSLVPQGAGLPMTMAAGAVEGGVYGALSASGAEDGDLKDRALAGFRGGGTGLVLGAAAPAVLAGGGQAYRYLDGAIRANIGTPAQQAYTRIINAGRYAGLDEAAVNQRLAELGQEGMLVDVLGPRGEALARSAANVSPEAQGVLEGASYGRMAGQNDRVAASLEQASGLPAGSRATVDDLKAAAYDARSPEIGAAYREARDAGFDIPMEPFEDILNSPMGQVEFRRAMNAARNRYAAGDANAASRLGVLDELKKGFDARARVADRAGDNNVADQARRLATLTRRRLDEALEGPPPDPFVLDGSQTQVTRNNPYARARRLRQDAYREEEAFDLGAELAAGRVPLNGPTRARAAALDNPDAVAQGYAAESAETLLNRRGTPGAIDGFGSRLAQESMDAALGQNAGQVRQRLAAEQQFGRTHRALTGNSTTARQLAQMGLTAGAGAGLGLYSGMDPASAGITGIAAALARKGGSAAISAIRSNNEAAVAPYMARFLTEHGLPETVEGVRLVMRTPWMRQLLGRSLAVAGGGEASRAR